MTCCPASDCPHDVVCEPRASETAAPPALLPSALEEPITGAHVDCPAWPRCGREVTGWCACTTMGGAPINTAPTVPAPRPSVVEQYVAARTVEHEHALSRNLARAKADELYLAMSPDERASAVEGYVAVVIGRWKAGA
jgi:hypothetical protein